MYFQMLILLALAIIVSLLQERSRAFRAIWTTHKQLIKLLYTVFMFITNLICTSYQYPVFGLAFTVVEVAILVSLLLGGDYITAAFKSLFHALYSLCSINLFVGVAAQADGRIVELQEMVNTLLEQNHKLLLEVQSLDDRNGKLLEELKTVQASVESGSTFLSRLAKNLTGSSTLTFHVVELVLLISLVITLILIIVYLCTRPRPRSIEYMQLEAYRKGSEFFPCARPAAVVQLSDADVGQPLGHGVIVENPVRRDQVLLVTAEHVSCSAEKIRVESSTGGKAMTITNRPVALGSDIVAFPLTKGDVRGNLGVMKTDIMRLSLLSVDTAMPAVSVHADHESSLGVLKPSGTFGVVAYMGSTKPGFSGTPYVVGKTVHGIHTGAVTNANLGVDAALIAARAIRHFKSVDQSCALETDDTVSFLYKEVQDLMSNKKNVVWQHYGGDQYEVKIKGKYFVVYEEDMQEMGLLAKEDFLYKESFPTRTKAALNQESYPSYDDSGNGQRASALVQGPGACQCKAVVPCQPPTVSPPAPVCPTPPVESPSTSTSPPPSTSAPPEQALPLILASLKELIEQQRRMSVAIRSKKKAPRRIQTPSSVSPPPTQS